jgi:hypothetical protein
MAQDSYGNYIASFTIPELVTVPIVGGTGLGGGYEGSGPPTLTPTSSPAYYIDTDTGEVHWYYNGGWAPGP